MWEKLVMLALKSFCVKGSTINDLNAIEEQEIDQYFVTIPFYRLVQINDPHFFYKTFNITTLEV